MIRQLAAILIIVSFSWMASAEEPAVVIAQAEPPKAAGEPAKPESAAPASTGDKDPTYMICKNKTVVRTLRVSKKPDGGCMTTYTKDGVDQVVGQSWAVERCAKVLLNIRDNLEKANWKCKDISEARVSSSEK